VAITAKTDWLKAGVDTYGGQMQQQLLWFILLDFTKRK